MLATQSRTEMLLMPRSASCTLDQTGESALGVYLLCMSWAGLTLLMSSPFEAKWLPHRRQVNTLPCTACHALISAVRRWHGQKEHHNHSQP